MEKKANDVHLRQMQLVLKQHYEKKKMRFNEILCKTKSFLEMMLASVNNNMLIYNGA